VNASTLCRRTLEHVKALEKLCRNQAIELKQLRRALEAQQAQRSEQKEPR
jgi:hypothetical protein